jgi:hypothetical protein
VSYMTTLVTATEVLFFAQQADVSLVAGWLPWGCILWLKVGAVMAREGAGKDTDRSMMWKSARTW